MGVPPMRCGTPHRSMVLHRSKQSRKRHKLRVDTNYAALLLVSVEYDRCWRSTARPRARCPCHNERLRHTASHERDVVPRKWVLQLGRWGLRIGKHMSSITEPSTIAPALGVTVRPADVGLRQISAAQWKSGAAAWLGWMFDGLDMHLYTIVAAPFVASL